MTPRLSIVLGPFIPPLATGPANRISPQADASCKRDDLPTTVSPLGLMEMPINRQFLAEGRTLHTDGAIIV